MAKENHSQESIIIPKDDRSQGGNEEEQAFVPPSKIVEKSDSEKGFSLWGSSLERQFHYQCQSGAFEKCFHYQVPHPWHVLPLLESYAGTTYG